MWQISAGLGLGLLLLAGSFKIYYDKTQAEIEINNDGSKSIKKIVLK